MKRKYLYLSSVCEDYHNLAIKYNLGIEIAQYCTAYNMDEKFKETNIEVIDAMHGIDRFTFHAPFNELCPAAIDPKVKQIAYERYIQAFKLASSYNINKIIIHSGYIPLVYYKSYFVEEAVKFFKEILTYVDEKVVICLENVMEDEADMLFEIVSRVNDKRFGLCLDIGHANASSDIDVIDWLKKDSKFINHFHIHNNYGARDEHNSLDKGNIKMKEFFDLASKLCPNATYTIESMDALNSIKYLIDNKILED